MSERSFVPAAGHDWLLPFYDPLCSLLGTATHLAAFVAEADLQPGQRILEIGCGTGNLALLVKRLHPDVEVVGLDPDPKALARARRKADHAGLAVQLDQGFSQELPYPDSCFDGAFSSFMFHHLDLDTKAATLRETRRVLKPRGSLHLLDFGGHSHGWLARLFHSSHELEDNAEHRVVALMREAGLANPESVAHRAMILGGITSYRAAA